MTPAEEVFRHWQETMERPQAIMTPKRQQLIQARLREGYTVERLKAAIDGCKRSPFHMGQNDRKRRFDSIELILRDAKHIEDFEEQQNIVTSMAMVGGLGYYPGRELSQAEKDFDAQMLADFEERSRAKR